MKCTKNGKIERIQISEFKARAALEALIEVKTMTELFQ
jgi:hypothetical protein